MIYMTPRYNGLLAIINKTIKDLRLAIRGQIVMTEELEKVAAALFDNQVGTKQQTSSGGIQQYAPARKAGQILQRRATL